MEREFALFEWKLAEACARVTAEYFQLPVTDADSVYRERVYCYELYHQLRSEWGDFPFSLSGEVDKARHPYFRGGPYARSKPDLLVHQPGNMDGNLACVEVKPSTGDAGEFRSDLKKLTWFCRNAAYHRGIFLVYGAVPGETADNALLKAKLRGVLERNGEIDVARISVFAHNVAEQRAVHVDV